MSTNYVNKDTGELVTLANGTRMWIGTQSAHDLAVQQGTMPNNCMVCITDDAAGEEAWQYSTNETRTGKTWIDGKPIYRKVIDCGALPDATSKSISAGVPDLDTLIEIRGMAYSSSTVLVIPYIDPHALTQGVQMYYSKTTQSVVIGTSDSFSTLYTKSIAVMEYTKTTD